MFINASLELPVTMASAVEQLYPALRQQRLDEVSDAAYEAGLITLRKVGPFGDLRLMSKTVRVTMLEPLPVKDGVRVQFRWVAAGLTGQLFPTLDADLDILAVDEGRCVLSIKAVYTPPLGAAGTGIDRLILHRAARATVRSLLHDLGRSLTGSDETPLGPYTTS